MKKFSRYWYLKNYWQIITRCYNCYKEICRKGNRCGHKALDCLIDKPYIKLFDHYLRLSYRQLELAGYFEPGELNHEGESFGEVNPGGNSADVIDVLVLVVALASKMLLVVQEILRGFYLRLQLNQLVKHRTRTVTSFLRGPPGKRQLFKTQVPLRRVLVSDIL